MANDRALKVIVRGNNVVAPPLFETTDARTIEFYDSTGELVALLIRGVLAPEAWAFANKLDDDWQETLLRYGYSDVSKTEFESIMQGKG